MRQTAADMAQRFRHILFRHPDLEEMEEEAQAVKAGETSADIKDPDEIIDNNAGDGTQDD
mgnify:CR=1 FL=1